MLKIFSLLLFCGLAHAQTLSGRVTSAEEGAMEGVLVSARQAGSRVTLTVVSDAQGRYSFPASRLQPGTYSLGIRAVGYELGAPATATVLPQGTTLDLHLVKASNLAAQLSNAEWIASVPGTHSQKRTLLNCVGCHTLERVVRSTHDSAGFVQTLQRMAGYANQSTPLRPQRRLADRDRELIGEERARFQREQAEWLSGINLSAGPSWRFALQSLLRPSGPGTRAIITEYDLPRPTIEPHDVVVDADGMAWYSDFGDQSIGKLDPKSGKVTEYPVPELKKGWPTGLLSLRFDREQNLWAGMMYQGAIARLDRKSGQLQLWSIPPELNKANTQINMTSPLHFAVDGKMWTQNNGFAAVHRIDLASGKWETFEPFKDSKRNHNIYDVIADSKNNVYFTDFSNEHIGRIDGKTGVLTLFTIPTPRSAPRRAQMDASDRLWFAEYRGNKIGMFDTRTEVFTEWTAPRPWSQPYDVQLDKHGEAWTGSMLNDRVLRLDTKTGAFTEYLLPRSTNIRRVFVDSSTTPVAVWVGSNHRASLVQLEPPD